MVYLTKKRRVIWKWKKNITIYKVGKDIIVLGDIEFEKHRFNRCRRFASIYDLCYVYIYMIYLIII